MDLAVPLEQNNDIISVVSKQRLDLSGSERKKDAIASAEMVQINQNE